MTKQLALKGGKAVRTKLFSPWPIHDEREKQELLEVLESGAWAFNGPKEALFSSQFASYCQVPYAFCVSNGTVSLEIALRALGIGPGDEVIVPSLTWMATALAVVNVGARPIFADVRKEDWCIDPKEIRRLITPRTKAIIPVHLYSQMAEMDDILALAKQANLKVIEDCAHAHGAQWKGKSAGSLGDIGSFSFQLSKAMTAGEGGILTTKDAHLAEKIFPLKNCGRAWKSDTPPGFGGNFRLTEFQAAVLIAQLERLPSQILKKRANAEKIAKAFGPVTGLSVLPWKNEVTQHGLYGLGIRIQPEVLGSINRDLFLKALQAEGIPVRQPYEVVYRASNWKPGKTFWKWPKGVNVDELLGLHVKTPVAEDISLSSGFILDHYALLGSKEDMDDIIVAFQKVLSHLDDLRFDAFKNKAKQYLKKLWK